MRIISEISQSVLTEYGGYRLKYELLEYEPGDEEEDPYYGIRICQKRSESMDLFDICQIRGITDEIDKARRLFAKAVEGLVMPVSLPDFVDDWHASDQAV